MVCVNVCIDFEKARQKRKRDATDQGEVERGPVFGIATTSRLWVILKLSEDGKSFQRSDEMTLPLSEIAHGEKSAIETANTVSGSWRRSNSRRMRHTPAREPYS